MSSFDPWATMGAPPGPTRVAEGAQHATVGQQPVVEPHRLAHTGVRAVGVQRRCIHRRFVHRRGATTARPTKGLRPASPDHTGARATGPGLAAASSVQWPRRHR